jgi:hypothetical protein
MVPDICQLNMQFFKNIGGIYSWQQVESDNRHTRTCSSRKKKDECDSKQQVKDPYGFLVCMITCTVLLRECLCTKDGNKDQVDSGHPSN